MSELRKAWNRMSMFIAEDRLENIAKLAQVSPADAARFIDGGPFGWANAHGDQHQAWLDITPDQEIADWIIAGAA